MSLHRHCRIFPTNLIIPMVSITWSLPLMILPNHWTIQSSSYKLCHVTVVSLLCFLYPQLPIHHNHYLVATNTIAYSPLKSFKPSHYHHCHIITFTPPPLSHHYSLATIPSLPIPKWGTNHAMALVLWSHGAKRADPFSWLSGKHHQWLSLLHNHSYIIAVISLHLQSHLHHHSHIIIVTLHLQSQLQQSHLQPWPQCQTYFIVTSLYLHHCIITPTLPSSPHYNPSYL